MTISLLAPLAYRPFLDPLPLWDYWALLLFPLVLGISTVYQAIRTEDLKRLPLKAALSALWIFLGIAGVAAGVQVLIWLFR